MIDSVRPPLRVPADDALPKIEAPKVVALRPSIQELQANKASAVRQHCQALILQSYPLWKQTNDLTDAGPDVAVRQGWLAAMRATSKAKVASIEEAQNEAAVDVVSVKDGWPEMGSVALSAALDQAPAEDDDHLFSDTDDISEKQALEADLAQTREQLAIALEENAALKAREPEVRIVERVVEVSSPEAAPLKIIPDEIAAMMDPGDTFSPEVRRKLTERLNVELAELKNLRGLAGEDLKREAEIEKLLGLFARLGEI